jgi:hypothetical protein
MTKTSLGASLWWKTHICCATVVAGSDREEDLRADFLYVEPPGEHRLTRRDYVSRKSL